MWKLNRYALTFILMTAMTGVPCRFTGQENHYRKRTICGNVTPVHKTMTFKNPLWLKINFYAGMVFLPLMATGASYLIYEAALNKNMLPLLFFISGFIFFGYTTFRRAGLAQFINAEISFTDEGIEIKKKNHITHIRWSQVKRIINSPHFQLYSVYNHTNKPILTVDHSIPGFAKLKKTVENCTNTKPEKHESINLP